MCVIPRSHVLCGIPHSISSSKMKTWWWKWKVTADITLEIRKGCVPKSLCSVYHICSPPSVYQVEKTLFQTEPQSIFLSSHAYAWWKHWPCRYCHKLPWYAQWYAWSPLEKLEKKPEEDPLHHLESFETSKVNEFWKVCGISESERSPKGEIKCILGHPDLVVPCEITDLEKWSNFCTLLCRTGVELTGKTRQSFLDCIRKTWCEK